MRQRAQQPKTSYEFETVLGVRFLNGPATDAMALLSRGALMVVPSAPVLVMVATDPRCRAALSGADFAIVDSAYLRALWWLFKRKWLRRVSGLEFLRNFLASDIAKPRGALFLVNPSDEHRDANLELLRSQGFDITETECYTAPIYDKDRIEDPELLRRLNATRPRYVLLNVGGGVQEPLGLYLKANLSYMPGIICTGAAIAFLTGMQAPISERADAWGLGWLVRSLDDPRQFVPRYLSSLQLARLVFQYGADMPAVGSR